MPSFPPLLFDGEGNANTNTAKSTYKSVLLKRYGEHSFFYQGRTLKSEKAVIIDGMPCLFLAPILGLKTFGDYVDFLLKRKVTKHFQEYSEIHVTFDQPSIRGFNLKTKVQFMGEAGYFPPQTELILNFWGWTVNPPPV